MFCKNTAMKNFTKVVKKLFWRLFSRLQCRCFSVNFAKSFCLAFFIEHLSTVVSAIFFLYNYLFVTYYPTNIPRVFHVETTWKRSFPRHFNVEYTRCVCRVNALSISDASKYNLFMSCLPKILPSSPEGLRKACENLLPV